MTTDAPKDHHDGAGWPDDSSGLFEHTITQTTGSQQEEVLDENGKPIQIMAANCVRANLRAFSDWKNHTQNEPGSNYRE